MDRTAHGASGTVRVYAHNPSPLMTKSTGRKKTPRKAANGQFLPARQPAARRTPAKRKSAGNGGSRRRNPAPTRRAASRRNPSFGGRAREVYTQVGGVLVGTLAAEQAAGLMRPLMPAATPPALRAAIPIAVAGAAGVALAGSRNRFVANAGLGMAASAGANALVVVINSINKRSAPHTSVPPGPPATEGARRRVTAAPPYRLPAAPAYSYGDGAGCGCSTTRGQAVMGGA